MAISREWRFARASASGVLLGLLTVCTHAAVYDWSSAPVNNDWGNDANWDGAPGFPEIFDTANVAVVPFNGFQPRLEITVDIDTLNIENGASVHTGNAQLFTFNLNLADAGSHLTVFNGPNALDAVVNDAVADTGGFIDFLGGTLRVNDQFDIAAGSSVQGFGRLELNADQANIPSNNGTISAFGALIIDDGPAATRHFDWDGNDSGTAMLSAELGGTLDIRIDQNDDPFDGTISVTSGSTLRNEFDWSQNFGRNMRLNSGGGTGVATIEGGTFFSFGNVFIEGGTGRFDAFFHGRFGSVELADGATWHVHNGIFDDNDGSQEVQFRLGGNNEWIVDGDFTVNEQGFTFDWDGAFDDLTTTVNGSLFGGGVLTINADQIDTGNPNTSGYDGTINLNEGTLRVNTASPWRLEGTLNLNSPVIGATPTLGGSHVRVEGTVNAQAPQQFVGGGAINSQMTLVSGGTLNIDSRFNLTHAAELTINSGATANVAGTLNVSGAGANWQNSGTLHLEAGRVSGNGIVNSGVTHGYGTIALSGDFVNDGTIDAEGTALDHTLVFDGTGGLDLDGTVGGGMVDATFGSIHIMQPIGATVFDGTLTIGVLREVRIDDGWINNTGVVNFNGGTYIASNFEQNGALVATSDFTAAIMADSVFRAGSTTTIGGPQFGGLRLIGNSTIEAGATFSGTRSLSLEDGTAVLHHGADVGVPVSNGAEMELGASPGQVTVAGFTQESTGQLHVEIGGHTAGTEFDQLVVTGAADLDGTLLVSLVDLGGGFPLFSSGEMFPILTAGGGLGGTTFASETLPALTGGLFMDVNYTAGGVTLVVEGVVGDYNADGTVNAADYTVWRDTFGETGSGLAADGDGDGEIGDGDYGVWREHFGQIAGVGSASRAAHAAAQSPSRLGGPTLAVTEPTAIVLLIAISVVATPSRRRLLAAAHRVVPCRTGRGSAG